MKEIVYKFGCLSSVAVAVNAAAYLIYNYYFSKLQPQNVNDQQFMVDLLRASSLIQFLNDDESL